MKDLINYINEYKITNLFNTLDNEIIYESLNCKILRDIAKQLKTLKTNRQKQLNDEDDVKKEQGYFWGASKAQNKTFKEIFGEYSKVIQWDKVDDSDVKFISKEDFAKTENKVNAEIRKIIQGKLNSIVAAYKDSNYTYIMFPGGDIYMLNSTNNSGYNLEYGSRYNLKQADKIEKFKDSDIYFIPLQDKNIVQKIQQQRRLDKSGMVYTDPESLRQMAQANVDRYKKIVAQNKAKRENNEDLLNECGKIISKISELSIEIAKDPITNADKVYAIGELTKYIYDKQRYVEPNRYRKEGYYTGVNGLLPTIAEYTNARNKASTGSYSDMYQKEMQNKKTTLEKSVEKIKELMKKYNIEY